MAVTTGLTVQWKLNILASTPGQNRSILQCLNTLNAANDASEQDAWNRWAGTTGLRKQDAANVKANTVSQKLRIKDCINLI